MIVNTRVRYGLRTMIELTKPSNKSGIFQKDIAKNQNISEKYLDSIISGLKVAGLIVNAGGKKSGYVLAKLSNEITVYDIYCAFEEVPCLVPCALKEENCTQKNGCASMEYWIKLNKTLVRHMKSTNLEQLSARESYLIEKRGSGKSKKCRE